jgi:hypothetical protein
MCRGSAEELRVIHLCQPGAASLYGDGEFRVQRPRYIQKHVGLKVDSLVASPLRVARGALPRLSATAKRPDDPGVFAHSGWAFAYCGLTCAETAFDESDYGSPLSWFKACFNWKSSVAPN